MSFRSIVKFCVQCHLEGYLHTRQEMLDQGASLVEIHKLLAWRLRILG